VTPQPAGPRPAGPRADADGAAPAHPAVDPAERPVLPDQTGDDLDIGWGERFADTADDERFLRERPPHWE